jgi:hypothetical protein
VIKNVVHVSNAGVVATWYFMSNNMPANPSLQALRRACTTSFGSICLGSLLVAIVQLIKEMIERQRRQSDGLLAALMLCCMAFIVGIIEWLLELFNHWAFVQVAIYGKDFKTAAKDTLQLVKSKGLDGLVNMNLTGQAVFLGTMIGMVLTGGIVAIAAYVPILSRASDPSLGDDAKQVYTAAYGIAVAIAVVFGMLFAVMVSTTVNSGVTTLFVCWAEDPASLQASNPELHQKYEAITARWLSEHETGGAQPPQKAYHQQPYGAPPPQQAYGAPPPSGYGSHA